MSEGHPSGVGDFSNNTTDRDLARARFAERRRHRRWDGPLAVYELRPERHLVRATSVSAGGVFCPELPGRAQGDEIFLQIEIPNGPTLAVTGRIARASHTAFGVGIAFDRDFPELAPPRRTRRRKTKP